MKTAVSLAILLVALASLAMAADPVTQTVTIRTSDGAVLNTVAANFTAGKLKVGGVTVTTTPAWSSITGTPITLAGYGITRPGDGDGSGGAAGGIEANGGNGSGSEQLGGAAGWLRMNGADFIGANGGAAGSINTSANSVFSGGSLILNSNGFGAAGSINTQAGGSLTMGAGDLTGPAASGTILTDSDIGSTVQGYSALLQAVSGLGTNGLIVRASGSSIAARTISGTAGEITVTNGSGVSGNPTLSLAATGVSAGTYDRVTVNAQGRVTSAIVRPRFSARIDDGNYWGIEILSDTWTAIGGTGDSYTYASGHADPDLGGIPWIETYDSTGDFNPVTGKFTAPISGIYRFYFAVQYCSGVNSVGVGIYINSTTLWSCPSTFSQGNDRGFTDYHLNAGDFVQFATKHYTGGSSNYLFFANYFTFSGEWVAP